MYNNNNCCWILILILILFCCGGNGFGCGVVASIAGLGFGKPWDRAWTDYLTGYNSPVQDGKFVAPTYSPLLHCVIAEL